GDRPNQGQQGEAGVVNGEVDGDLQAAPGIEVRGEIRVLAQTVVISDISFINESFRVHTEITALPLSSDLRNIHLHLGSCKMHFLELQELPTAFSVPGALLPRELGGHGRITINGADCDYSRLTQPTLAAQSPNLSIMETLPQYYNSINEKDAFLQITIPDALRLTIQLLKCITIAVDVVVEKPTQGIKFVYNIAPDGTLDKGAHVFTYRSSLLTSTTCLQFECCVPSTFAAPFFEICARFKSKFSEGWL
ncbi:hypothetical protein COOONC_24957, partial [Cooperia oncophora]